MAYTIISQNNTTTTLSDENGNVITVPARVTLATSTDYTITKVNNNSVDLESGDGKIIRGVPACVVLAGGGGGSDPHNLGFYADLTALQTAYPTGSDGDFAILGSTDTVWVWDSGTSAWKDTDTKGQVTSVNGQTGAVTIPDELPSQTGNSGKFLTTDGTDVSWGDALVNSATGTNALSIGYATSSNFSVGVGPTSQASGQYSVSIGDNSKGFGEASIGIGKNAECLGANSVGIGGGTAVTAVHAIQLGHTDNQYTTNSDANTFKVGNANGNFEIMSADGTIPADRLVKSINKYSTMPTASADNLGWIVQFTGTTDSTYTHGYLYECVSDGQTPATYSWVQTNVQPAPTGLPDQTGQSGKFLTTDGTTASWTNALKNNIASYNGIVVGNEATGGNTSVTIGTRASGAAGTSGGIAIGYRSSAGKYGIGIGNNQNSNAPYSLVISTGYGFNANYAKTGSIYIGGFDNAGLYQPTYFNSGTLYVGLRNVDADDNVKIYPLLEYSGTIPHERLTNAVISNAITVEVADWNGGTTVTKTISGLTATSIIWVAPDSASQSDYLNAGVYASAQATDSITFTCTTTPTSALTINVIYC